MNYINLDKGFTKGTLVAGITTAALSSVAGFLTGGEAAENMGKSNGEQLKMGMDRALEYAKKGFTTGAGGVFSVKTGMVKDTWATLRGILK